MTTQAPADMTTKLTLDTSEFRAALLDADRLAKGFSASLSQAFVGVALKGRSLGDVMSQLALRLSQLALTSALRPVEQGLAKALSNGLSGLLGGGGGQATGPPMSILPFAEGGVISRPSYFPLGSGLGLAGEAGAEAILPLARGPDGSLGVRASGGGAAPVTVTVNIATPDVAGFRRSEAEIAASLARIVGRGRRGT
jgi:phage-related minor tail protein